MIACLRTPGVPDTERARYLDWIADDVVGGSLAKAITKEATR